MFDGGLWPVDNEQVCARAFDDVARFMVRAAHLPPGRGTVGDRYNEHTPGLVKEAILHWRKLVQKRKKSER